MKRVVCLAVGLLSMSAVGLWGCTPAAPSGPGTVSSLSPATGYVGAEVTVTVRGEGFGPALTQPLDADNPTVTASPEVLVDGTAVPTTYVSAGQLSAKLPATLDLGTHTVTARRGSSALAGDAKYEAKQPITVTLAASGLSVGTAGTGRLTLVNAGPADIAVTVSATVDAALTGGVADQALTVPASGTQGIDVPLTGVTAGQATVTVAVHFATSGQEKYDFSQPISVTVATSASTSTSSGSTTASSASSASSSSSSSSSAGSTSSSSSSSSSTDSSSSASSSSSSATSSSSSSSSSTSTDSSSSSAGSTSSSSSSSATSSSSSSSSSAASTSSSSSSASSSSSSSSSASSSSSTSSSSSSASSSSGTSSSSSSGSTATSSSSSSTGTSSSSGTTGSSSSSSSSSASSSSSGSTGSTVSASKSKVEVDHTSVTADNTAIITVTVTVLDASSQPISGAAVTVSMNPAHGTVTAVQATSNASGVATFTLKDTTAESVTVSATASGVAITQQQVVVFAPGAPDTGESTITVPTTLSADATGTVSVTLLDAYDNPVGGETVGFSANPSTDASFPGGATCITNSAGTCQVNFRDTKAGDVLVTAADGALSLSDTVTVTHGVIDAATYGSLAVSPASGAVGDGLDRARHTFTVQDAHGNAIGGVSVTATVDPAATSDVFFAAATKVSDASGKVSFDVKAPSAGQKSVVFTFTGLTPADTVAVTFVATRTLPAWIQRAALPTPREGFGYTLGADGRVYALGGRDGSGPLSVVEAFDPVARTWATLTALPKTQALPAALTLSGIIQNLGGYGTVADTDNQTTTNGSSYNAGPSLVLGRNFAAATVCGGFGVVAGGYASSQSSITASVEVNTGASWVSNGNMLTARNALGLVCLGNTLYAIGGFNEPGGNKAVLNVMEKSVVTGNTWTAAKSMPTARNELTTVVGADGRIYAIGGNTNATGETPIATVEAYDATQDLWFPSTPLAAARRSHGAVVISTGQIVVFGGAPEATFLATEVYGPNVVPGLLVGTLQGYTLGNFAASADVTFTDVASGNVLGSTTTDASGVGSVSVDFSAYHGVHTFRVEDDRSHYPYLLVLTLP